MTIYINGRFLTQPMTGVERYAYNLCKAMARLHQPFTVVCPKAPIHQDYDVSDLTIVHYGIGNSHFWEQCVLPFFFIGKKDYMVLSFTGLGSILIRHKVMTVHDLSFLKNPSWYSRTYYWYYKFMTPLAVKTSQHILTVSEFSKSEILGFYPFLKAENISVVYNAIDRQLFKPQTSDLRHHPSDLSPLCPLRLVHRPKEELCTTHRSLSGTDWCQTLHRWQIQPCVQPGLSPHPSDLRHQPSAL